MKHDCDTNLRSTIHWKNCSNHPHRLPTNVPAKKPLRQHNITSKQKRNHSSDERFSSLNTKLEPTANFDCKKCLKLLRFLEKGHYTVPRTISCICQTKSGSRYFSFASSHDTPRTSIHPRIQSSHPTKHINSDWVRVWCSTNIELKLSPIWELVILWIHSIDIKVTYMNIILLFEVQVKEWISAQPSQLIYATYAIAKRKSVEKTTFKSGKNHDEGRGWALLKFNWMWFSCSIEKLCTSVPSM